MTDSVRWVRKYKISHAAAIYDYLEIREAQIRAGQLFRAIIYLFGPNTEYTREA